MAWSPAAPASPEKKKDDQDSTEDIKVEKNTDADKPEEKPSETEKPKDDPAVQKLDDEEKGKEKRDDHEESQEKGDQVQVLQEKVADHADVKSDVSVTTTVGHAGDVARLRSYVAKVTANVGMGADGEGLSPPCRSYRGLVVLSTFESIESEITECKSKMELAQVQQRWKCFKH